MVSVEPDNYIPEDVDGALHFLSKTTSDFSLPRKYQQRLAPNTLHMLAFMYKMFSSS